MKTRPCRAGIHLSLGLLVSLLLLPGCGPQSGTTPPPPRPTPQPTAPPRAVSAEKTSFDAVTAQLDAGGSVYAYLSTARWMEGLSQKMEPWREFIASMPGMANSDRETVGRVFDTIGRIVKQSGVESISGVGFSGIALEPGFYRSKCVVHHYPNAGKGYLWTLVGTEAHPLDFADWLPTNTVWAVSLDLDVQGVWNALREQLQQSGLPNAGRGLDQLTQMAEQSSGMKFDELLGSLGGEIAMALTLDPEKKLPVPMPDGQGLQLPEPGLILALKVRDDRWFEWADRTLGINPQVIVSDDKATGLRMRTRPMPLPVPMEVRPSLARAGDYLWLTTHDRIMQQLVQVKAGKVAGLRSTPEFRKLMDGLPTQGNQFAFVSEHVQELLSVIQRTALAAAGSQAGGGPSPALMQKLFAMGGKVAAGSVGVIGPEGWLTVGHGYQEPAGTILMSALIAPTAILAGATLPALAQAKTKAQSINCVNNLKQMGLAAHIYATDHQDKFPPDFLSMKDELVTPRILICPLDPAATQAQGATWENLQPEAISYEYLGAGKTAGGNDSQGVLFRCRFHGHVCRMDGSVQTSGTNPR